MVRIASMFWANSLDLVAMICLDLNSWSLTSSRDLASPSLPTSDEERRLPVPSTLNRDADLEMEDTGVMDVNDVVVVVTVVPGPLKTPVVTGGGTYGVRVTWEAVLGTTFHGGETPTPVPGLDWRGQGLSRSPVSHTTVLGALVVAETGVVTEVVLGTS